MKWFLIRTVKRAAVAVFYGALFAVGFYLAEAVRAGLLSAHCP